MITLAVIGILSLLISIPLTTYGAWCDDSLACLVVAGKLEKMGILLSILGIFLLLAAGITMIAKRHHD